MGDFAREFHGGGKEDGPRKNPGLKDKIKANITSIKHTLDRRTKQMKEDGATQKEILDDTAQLRDSLKNHKVKLAELLSESTVDQATKDKISNLGPNIVSSLAKKYKSNPNDNADVGLMVSDLVNDPEMVNAANGEGLDLNDANTQAAIMDHLVSSKDQADNDMVGEIAAIGEKTNREFITGLIISEAAKTIALMEELEDNSLSSEDDGSIEARLSNMENKLANLQDSMSKIAGDQVEVPDENNVQIDIGEDDLEQTSDKMDMYNDQMEEQDEFDIHSSDYGDEFDDNMLGIGDDDAIGGENLDESDEFGKEIEDAFMESLNDTDIGGDIVTENVSKFIGNRYSGM